MEEKIEIENQLVSGPFEDVPQQVTKPDAFTVVIHSWATPIVGIIMLVIGLFAGFLGQPLLSARSTPVSAQVNPSTDTGILDVAAPTPDANLVAQQQELMNVVVDSTRHFRGDPNAPVTIIEFSDFQ